MPTINTIIKELKNIPVDKLEDIYSMIHSFRTDVKNTGAETQDILSYAGAFEDMSKSDYDDFLEQTKQTRDQLFDRQINL